MITPVILSGGAGTRLWPASRRDFPKQFLKLFGGESTFQATMLRLRAPDLFSAPIVVTGAAHLALVRDQLAEIGVEARIVVEPMRRDSGPAALAAALLVAEEEPSAAVLVGPADHFVPDADAFRDACRAAFAAAMDGAIVTFGLAPDRPETGFGYIRPGAPVRSGGRVLAVDRFVEKPDEARARVLIEEGCLWNSGNFLLRADVLAREYEAFEPESLEAVKASVRNAAREAGVIALDRVGFEAAGGKSFDYAVMERTSRAAVVPARYAWSDIGSWNAVHELSPRDAEGNVAEGRVILKGTRNSYVSAGDRLTAVIGADNLVVVVREDAVLVADRSRLGELKAVVEEIERGEGSARKT